ncbi:MAG: hypothetical protein ABIT71_24350 [Vicinamibacteraceae bacterium]
MNRVVAAYTLAIAGLIASAVLAAPATVSAQAPSANVPATAAEAAPFLGDWTLTMQGPDRAAAFDLTIKVDGEKVVGEISSAEVAKEFIPEAWMAEKTFRMRYSFNYQGNPIDGVISLTPGADKVDAHIDFANGAYVMTGTAAKKGAAKP